MTITIYALADRQTNKIRYIGMTRKPLVDRLVNHFMYAIGGGKAPRAAWLRKTIRVGTLPRAITLAQMPDDADWASEERRWIAYGRAQGWPLLNVTDGGDGGWKLTAEQKAKAIKTRHEKTLAKHANDEPRIRPGRGNHTNHTMSEETKEKIRKALIGKKLTEETKKKLSEKSKGNHNWPKTPWNKGKRKVNGSWS